MQKNSDSHIDNKAPDIGKIGDPPGGIPALCRPVRSARSAKKYLARLLVAYQKGEINATNAKTSVYVLSEYLRAVEVSEFEARLEALENKTKGGEK
jgi:hypothetical protein